MIKITEVLAEQDITKRVALLKAGRTSPQPDITESKSQWEPNLHHIFNTADRPDKTVYYTQIKADGTEGSTLSRIEKVARVPLAIQKLITKRAASFLFGNPVKTVSSNDDSKTFAAVSRILRDNKEDTHNRKVARTLFSTTEVAEYWYPVVSKKPFNTYGFKTDIHIKVAVFDPLKGDLLFPYFDETGVMVAFSREYTVKEGNIAVVYFETWTDTTYFRWKQDGAAWVKALDKDVELKLGKIPIVYGCQECVEWADVQHLIDRLEKLISNFADTNDYHGSPKIAVSGEVAGFSKKGETGAILELTDGATAQYLSWDHAPESIKLEIENTLRMIYSITQTPDISFEAVKGLGSAASGQSLKMLFLDAHLKVMDHMEVFNDFLQRRLNILKAFIAVMEPSLQGDADEVELTPVVVPFMVNDEGDKIHNLMTAKTAGIISQQTAVAKNPLVEDAKAEMELIKAEQDVIDEKASELNNIQNEPV